MRLETDFVCVEWVYMCEGRDGVYNPDDPDDTPLLRFDVYQREHLAAEWEPVSDASYCTGVSVDTPLSRQATLLGVILASVQEPILAGESVRRICENLSWLS